MTWLQLSGLATAVLVGAGTQRVTGLGFALVSTPFVVLVTDPFNGVVLVNILGVVTALLVLGPLWRQVEPRRAAMLTWPAVLAVLPGAWVARNVAAPVLAVLVGGLVLVALVAVIASERARVLRGGAGAVVAGSLSGFMNATAGAGGPALTVYAVSTGWQHRRFAATAQLVFAVQGIASLVAKGHWPSLPATGWILVAAGLAVGIVAGNVLAHHVPAQRARTFVVALALVGAAITVVKGLSQL